MAKQPKNQIDYCPSASLVSAAKNMQAVANGFRFGFLARFVWQGDRRNTTKRSSSGGIRTPDTRIMIPLL